MGFSIAFANKPYQNTFSIFCESNRRIYMNFATLTANITLFLTNSVNMGLQGRSKA